MMYIIFQSISALKAFNQRGGSKYFTHTVTSPEAAQGILNSQKLFSIIRDISPDGRLYCTTAFPTCAVSGSKKLRVS